MKLVIGINKSHSRLGIVTSLVPGWLVYTNAARGTCYVLFSKEPSSIFFLLPFILNMKVS